MFGTVWASRFISLEQPGMQHFLTLALTMN
jgi:hypothetical protein